MNTPMGEPSTTRILYTVCALAFTIILFNQLTRERPPAYERVSSTDELSRYARSTLASLQERSIANNQEYCGVIFEDERGNLQTSKIYEGERATCDLDWGVPLGNHVVASFHTHGGYDADFDSEMPSVEDLANDIDARIEGFIATPGGRIWHVGWKNEAVTQLCGEGCLKQDPRYDDAQEERIALTYTFDDLQAREGYVTKSE